MGITARRLLGETSRTREHKKGSDMVSIGRTQRVNVTLTKVPGAHQVRSTPGKDGPVLSLGQHIRHQTGVAAITVGKWVDQNQAVMKADRQFIRRIGSVFHPIPRITEQGSQSLADFMMGNANVFLCGSIQTSQKPGLIEHTSMKIS